MRLNVLYFDCFSGISGNMALGALLELGVPLTYLLDELNKVNVDGYRIEVTKVKKNGIGATYVNVVLEDTLKVSEEYHHKCSPEHSHNEVDHQHKHSHDHSHEEEHHHHEHIHDHDHHHVHRTYADIVEIIDESGITAGAKKLAQAIFSRIAKAEAKVHQETIDEVHFHEVGAVDSIVDIIGTAILIDKLAPDKIIASVVNDGHGFTYCQHGKIPIPVPATVEIFADAKVRSKQIDIEKELVTPTGAAIIAELATQFTQMPEMIIRGTGYGAGTRDLEIPNVVRVVQGEVCIGFEEENLQDSASSRQISQNHNHVNNQVNDQDEIIVMHTNIDDCSPEVLGYAMECLFTAGAKDVYFTPIHMKKNRMATMLTVLCDESSQTKLEEIIFKETTTIGIRIHKEYRKVLPRKASVVLTPYGELNVKEIIRDGETVIVPEFESARELALKNNIAIQKIYSQVEQA